LPLRTPSEADMTLVRCPGCHNQVSRESVRCPVCGCNFTATTIRHYTKWAILLLLVIYFVNRYVIRKLPFHREPHSIGWVVPAAGHLM
jgi:hypothetical protein